MTAWTLDHHDMGIARLTFDLPGEKVNKLTSAAMLELDEQLGQLSAYPMTRFLVIASGKPGIFIAGADIDEIAALSDPETAADKARRGQEILNRLATLRFPSVALIDGACLGGGLELALACTYRVATQHPKTQLGQPEVKLGVIPGFGGTQRLPRLIGLPQALKLILSGKSVDGKKAAKLGLVDACMPHEFREDKLAEFIARARTESGRRGIAHRRPTGSLKSWVMMDNPLARAMIFRQSRRRVMEKTDGHYPAPLAALRVMKASAGKALDEGLEREARAFGELAVGDVAKHLIRLYYVDDALKKETGAEADVTPRPIARTAVVGAGVMGGGIAWLLSDQDLEVRLKDIGWEAIAKGFEQAAGIYAKLQELGKIDERQANLKLHRISGTLDYSGFRRADLVVEAVVEDLEVKRQVYADLETVCPTGTILATNTSTLPIDDLAAGLNHPERFLGMHFFNPVNRMPLVEVIPGARTSPEVVASVVAMARAAGKKPIVVKSCPGFLVNRLLLPYLNEAIYLLVEGNPPGRVDHLMSGWGMPMGPFRLMDEIGLDVAVKCARILAGAYGDRMTVAPFLEEACSTYGLLGKKQGRGFYLYDGKRPVPNAAVPEMMQQVRAEHGIRQAKATDDAIVDRLLLTMINEASRCLDEGIVASPAYLDMALILGTGFPPFRGGLLCYADQRGNARIVARLMDLAAVLGSRFAPSDFLRKMAKEEATFHETVGQYREASVPGPRRSIARDGMGLHKLHGRTV